MFRLIARVAEFMLIEAALRFVFRGMLLLAVILIAGWAVTGHAQQAVGAQPGTVIGVAYAAPTQDQTSYSDWSQYQTQTECETHNRAVIGGAIGGIVALLATRHSYNGQWAATAAGTAIGGAIGNSADQRDARRCEARQSRPATIGAQVIVRLRGGNTIAVFAHQPFSVGEKVWLIGNGELVAASQ